MSNQTCFKNKKKKFTAIVNGFYDLQPMIHVACIFAEYQSGAIADHCFEAIT